MRAKWILTLGALCACVASANAEDRAKAHLRTFGSREAAPAADRSRREVPATTTPPARASESRRVERSDRQAAPAPTRRSDMPSLFRDRAAPVASLAAPVQPVVRDNERRYERRPSTMTAPVGSTTNRWQRPERQVTTTPAPPATIGIDTPSAPRRYGYGQRSRPTTTDAPTLQSSPAQAPRRNGLSSFFDRNRPAPRVVPAVDSPQRDNSRPRHYNGYGQRQDRPVVAPVQQVIINNQPYRNRRDDRRYDRRDDRRDDRHYDHPRGGPRRMCVPVFRDDYRRWGYDRPAPPVIVYQEVVIERRPRYEHHRYCSDRSFFAAALFAAVVALTPRERELTPCEIARSRGTWFDTREEALDAFWTVHRDRPCYRNDFASQPVPRPSWIPRETRCGEALVRVWYTEESNSYGFRNTETGEWIKYDVWEDEVVFERLALSNYYLWPGHP